MLFSTTEKRYEQVDNNRFCTYSICSSLWFVKYNSRFYNRREKNVHKMIRLRAEETKEHNQTTICDT